MLKRPMYFHFQNKSGKQKQLSKTASPTSPKLHADAKRSRAPFHRRSPPMEKLLKGDGTTVVSQPMASTSQSTGSSAGSSSRVNAGTSASSLPPPGSIGAADHHNLQQQLNAGAPQVCHLNPPPYTTYY